MKDNSKANIPDRSRPGSTTTAPSIGKLQGGGDKLATEAKKNTFKLPTEETTIGTWNVRTLNGCGKVEVLEHELKRYQWQIIGLSEVRWTGIGETTTNDGHKIWFSGHETAHKYGVGFIVRKEAIGCVKSCMPVSSRIISMQVSAKPKNITLIQVYAPTSDHSDEEVETFYEELEQTIKKAPRKDIVYVMGDFNAKIGPDAHAHWAGTVGRFGTGETNDRGLRLLEFASSHKLTIANTLYPHKPSRRTTWHSPDGKTHNQIDYILTPKRFKSSINKPKTRTFPGADVGSDHDLVLLTMKLKLKKNFKAGQSRIKYDLDKLKDQGVLDIFQAQVGGKFAALTILDKDIDDLTNDFNEVMKDAAEEVLGKKRKKKQAWMTDEVLSLCDKRRELKQHKYKSKAGAKEYSKANKHVRKKIEEAKENWISDQCCKIEEGMKHGNSKAAFDTLKTLTKTQENKSPIIEDKIGEPLTDSTAILERWTEYCQELYNFPISPDQSLLEDRRQDRTPSKLPVLREEVEEAIKSLPIGKSPGADNIPAELIKNGGEEVTNLLTKICQKIWETKTWPTEWTQIHRYSTSKKG